MEGKTFSKCVFCWGLSVFLSLFVVLKTVESQEKPGSNQTRSPYSSSYALVIGIENYQNDKIWPPPGKAIEDAELVEEVLKKLGFNVTYRTDLDSSELEQTLKKFLYNKKIDNESRLFIWYSGHGQTIDGEGFLVPSDAPPKDDPDIKTKLFPIRLFDVLSRNTKAKYVYMVFDACFSSPIFMNESYDSSDIPIASTLKHKARQYLCSCTAGQNARDDDFFREMFIKVLQNEVNANANGDNYLTAGEIGSFIKKKMSATTWGKNQGPQYGRLKGYDVGEFIFLLPDKSPITGYLTKPGYFSDLLENKKNGPEMIAIPGGSFRMGDLKGDGFNDEKLVYNVIVLGIAVSRYEITFEEYDRYCDVENPNNDPQKEPRKPSDNGWGRGDRPVINISWEDAVKYTKWLSDQTGEKYRLPTEAEWEYFARAGTDTNYWWGNEIDEGNANCFDCGSQWGGDAEKKTAPVGSFGVNKFGIYDTVGNVWEWTCSEYTDEYNGKETKCLKEITTGGEAVVLRGGAWDEEPKKCRVSHRKVGYPGERSPNIGFRVVRELK